MSREPDILCIGSVLWDLIGRATVPVDAGADVPGHISRHPGGVALNIAITLARFGMRPALLSAIGRDAEGEELIAACTGLGLEVAHVFRPDTLPTGRYMAVEDGGGLIAAVADSHTLEAVGDAILRALTDGSLGSAQAPWPGLIVLDGGVTREVVATIATSPAFAAADLRIAPASPAKADRLTALLRHPRATFYVNLAEAGALCQTRFGDATAAARALRERGARRVLVTDGGNGVCDAAGDEVIGLTPPRVQVARVTGAGDTFMAAHIAAEERGAGRRAALAEALATAAKHVSGESPK